MKLHKKDMKILRELDFGARQPISVIARKVGLSPEVTAYRIKQLEQKGIITGYYPVIDLSKLGYMFCRFRLSLENMNPSIEEQFIDVAKSIPAIGWIVVAGSSTIGIVAYAKSIQEADKTFQQLNFLLPGFIKAKDFSIAHRIYHFPRKYICPMEEVKEFIWGENGNGKAVTIDETDKILLTLLTKDAKIKFTDLAPQAGLTSMAIINRIKRMEKEQLILGYRCSLNLRKLGMSHHKIYLYFHKISQERRESIKQVLRLQPYVVYLTEAVGRSDLEFEMHVPSDHEMYDCLKKLQQQFSEIRNFENTLFHREIIIRYFPEQL